MVVHYVMTHYAEKVVIKKKKSQNLGSTSWRQGSSGLGNKGSQQ
jgi:hypothetical protein